MFLIFYASSTTSEVFFKGRLPKISSRSSLNITSFSISISASLAFIFIFCSICMALWYCSFYKADISLSITFAVSSE
jgi:hypothetical protein